MQQKYGLKASETVPRKLEKWSHSNKTYGIYLANKNELKSY